MNRKKKGKYIGLAGALLVHVVVIALLILVGFTLPEQSEEGGVPVMMGETPDAWGAADPSLVEVETMPEEAAPEMPEEAEQEMLTQEDEETVAIKPKAEEKKKEVKKPEKSAAEKAEEARKLAAEKAERERKAAEEAARKRVAGAFGKGAQMGSKGATEGTALPTDLSRLLISATSVETGWKNLGHTSENNLPSWDRSGGDASSLNSWLAEGVRTTYDSVTVSVSVKALQADAETLKFVYNGWDNESGGIAVGMNPAAQEIAMIVVSYDPDTKKNFGTYMSNASMKADSMPDFSGDFVEFGFTATAQTSDTITASSTGEKAAFVFLTPDDFAPKK